MNDLDFVFYDAKRMLADMLDVDRDTELAHRRLCDFIWMAENPPKNDNDVLRELTKTPPQLWGKVRRGLEEKGWFVLGRFLTHHGAIDTLNAAAARHAENYNRTAAAGGRPVMVSAVDAATGIVRYCLTPRVAASVTTAVTPPVTEDVTNGQGEGEGERDGERIGKAVSPPAKKPASERGFGGKPEPPSECREIPDEEQAVTQCQTCGIEEKFVRFVYRQWAMQSGKNANGVIVDWLPYVTGRWKNECVEWRAGTHRGNKVKPTGGGGPVNRTGEQISSKRI